MDEQEFVVLPVAVVVIHRLRGATHREDDVAVEQDGCPGADGIAALCKSGCPKVMMSEDACIPGLECDLRT
jgi:hypothetical protein